MRAEETVVNIIFDAGRGTTPVASREGVCGEPYGKLPQPSRSGYEFAGWYLGETEITPETVIGSTEDLRLVARWVKKRGEGRRKTVMWKQKVFAGALAFTIALLTVAILIANQIVVVYHLTDKYVDAEGVVHSDRYTIKREDGVYKLFDRDGKLMETTENGYTSSSDNIRYEVYVAEASGNQYLINTSTGAYETYAVVDYDASVGESLGGTVKNKRVMMFPRVGQDNTYSIEVTNQYGTFKFYRENVESTDSSSGKKYTTAVMVNKGETPVLAAYDPTLFASLCVSCGYTLTMQKLDLSDPEAPRNADGTVDLNAYGLVDRYDEEGNLIYSPAVYTIVKAKYNADGSCEAGDESYTVRVGDAILSGGGYYVQLVGRDAVYITSSTIADTVLQPVESLVTPSIVYPMTVSTYVMVYNFLLADIKDMNRIPDDDTSDGETEATSEGEDTEGEETEDDNVTIRITFSYVDLAKRQDSMLSSSPYWFSDTTGASFGNGFMLDNDSVSTVLGNIYSMEFMGCRVLNPTDEDFETYNLVRNVSLMSFDYDPQVASGGSDPENWVENQLVISQKTENGTYMVYTALYNMIVEVDQSFFTCLEWSDSHWFNQYFFQHNISYVKDMSIRYGDKLYSFQMDNRFSYAYYDKDGVSDTGEGLGLASGTVMDPSTGELTQRSDGSYLYKKDGKSYVLSSGTVSRQYTEDGEATGKYIYTRTGTIIDLSTGTLNDLGNGSYSYTVTKTGITYPVRFIDLNNTVVKTYYTNSGTKATTVVYRDSDGVETTVSSGTSNLRITCNGTLIDYTISETVDTDTGTTKTETYTALDNFRRLYSKLLWYSIEGDASRQELGMGLKEFVETNTPSMEITVNLEDMASILNRDNFTENNKQYMVIRLYEYTERKALLTIEVLENADATPDPTKASGGFYVLASEMKELADYAEKYVSGVLLPKAY